MIFQQGQHNDRLGRATMNAGKKVLKAAREAEYKKALNNILAEDADNRKKCS